MTDTEPSEYKNLSPEMLVNQICQQRQRLFVSVFAETPFLLVRLNDPTGELRAGLAMMTAASSGIRAAKSDGLGFYTVAQSKSSQTSSFPSALRSPLNIPLLQQRIFASAHFIVELHKRENTSSFTNRVSVGRARNQDVVLRQSSVSKSHAWFETDEKGSLMVADAGSKNGTRVRGQRLNVRTPVQVNEGDVIEFGKVQTTFCGADTLWRLVNE